MKAVGLLSGGLDSTLALKLVKDQGIEIFGINFMSPFCSCTPKTSSCSASVKAAEQIGIQLKRMALGDEYLQMLKDPPHGYGSAMNPCIDCRILKLKKANEYRLEVGADFLVTGEVIGQRPMSQQKNQLMLIEKAAGLEGLILRPLSAGNLPETIPEEKGWVDRNELLSFAGRSRKPQIELAEQMNITDYPCPAGGCKLTEKEFSRKVKELLEHKNRVTLHDAQLLKTGRHFWFENEGWIIVGKNKDENRKLKNLKKANDTLMTNREIPGPDVLIRADHISKKLLDEAVTLWSRYSKKDLPAEIRFVLIKDDRETEIKVKSFAEIRK